MSAVPVPIADLWEWQQEGLCRTGNPEMFFHPEGERGPSRRKRAERAVAICQECPVLRKCRDHALRYREPYGVWGGMTEEERQRILAQGEYTGEYPGEERVDEVLADAELLDDQLAGEVAV